jgi:uncharacterized RDD family membrane protein YckC
VTGKRPGSRPAAKQPAKQPPKARAARPAADSAAPDAAASEPAAEPGRTAQTRPARAPYQFARGEKIGLPATGRGSPAYLGRRAGAFLIDAILSSLVASAFVQIDPSLPGIAGRASGPWSLVPLAIMYIGGLLLAGRTIGMAMLKLRVIRVDRNVAIDPVRALARTILLFLLIPAVIVDRDGRGFHDRITDTCVINV